MQLEVVELPLGQQIVAWRCIDEQTLADGPAILDRAELRFPAGEVLAVKQLQRLVPAGRPLSFQRGSAAGGPGQALAHVVGRLSLERVAVELAIEGEVVFAMFPL